MCARFVRKVVTAERRRPKRLLRNGRRPTNVPPPHPPPITTISRFVIGLGWDSETITNYDNENKHLQMWETNRTRTSWRKSILEDSKYFRTSVGNKRITVSGIVRLSLGRYRTVVRFPIRLLSSSFEINRSQAVALRQFIHCFSQRPRNILTTTYRLKRTQSLMKNAKVIVTIIRYFALSH